MATTNERYIRMLIKTRQAELRLAEEKDIQAIRDEAETPWAKLPLKVRRLVVRLRFLEKQRRAASAALAKLGYRNYPVVVGEPLRVSDAVSQGAMGKVRGRYATRHVQLERILQGGIISTVGLTGDAARVQLKKIADAIARV